jgi:anhydro-N-acetylmuramic acid kinase
MDMRPLTALGMMSGTSCDGIDAAIIETDGEAIVGLGATHYRPYSEDERALLAKALTAAKAWPADTPMPAEVKAADKMLTTAHAEVVRVLMEEAGLVAGAIDLIGFHGQTILHQPEARRTVQLGDGPALAGAIGIDTVYDFRKADVAAGGEGAPFAPLYHAARAREVKELPLLVVNIGGVSNVTWIGEDGTVIAFDTGPGNAPIDDWVREELGLAYDKGGEIAAAGTVDEARIAEGLKHPFFAAPPPKSLDRLDFTMALAEGLSPEDGAATLTAFTAAAIAAGARHCPAPPKRVLVTGGGRHNPTLMRELSKRLGLDVEPVEAAGWRGDMIEAEAFGFLAVRHVKGLPLSLPTTTGVPHPMPGGELAKGR